VGVAFSEAGESNLIRLEGTIDISQAAELKAALLKVFEQRKPVRVSLEQVSDLDVTAFQLLKAARLEAARSGLKLVVDGQPAESVFRSLANVGLDGFAIS
jgi:anti-anti-sigma factor